MFVRGNIPMTKEEVRVITLSKLKPGPDSVVWDIGSGTGSLSVEAALMSPGGRVYAVEKSPEGCRLTVENSIRFGADNVVVVEGEAPEALLSLPRPHRVMLGGSGGRLKDIVEVIKERLLPGGRLVINAVTLETLTSAMSILERGWETEVVQVMISKGRPVGSSRLMTAYNPVFIISASGWGEKNAG